MQTWELFKGVGMTRRQLQIGWPGIQVELLPGLPGYKFRYKVTGIIEEVAKWEKLLCSEYHPAGYGTMPLERPVFGEDGVTMTVVWGHSESCD